MSAAAGRAGCRAGWPAGRDQSRGRGRPGRGAARGTRLAARPRPRSGRHPAGPFAVLAGPRLRRPLASGQRHELGGARADQGDDQDVPHPPAAPGGHGPRRVRDRTPPSGPGDGPAQVGPGRNPRRPARGARRSSASPASDGPGPVRPPWWAALPPAGARIRCGPGEHVLRWADGRLDAMDHDDTEGELVLAALGGDKAECVAMLEAWGAHADDLDVLALGPRSPADELAVTPELVDGLRAAFGPAARSVPMRPGPAPGPAPGGGPQGRGPPRAHPGPCRRDQGRGPTRPRDSGRCGVVRGRAPGRCGACRPGGCPPSRNRPGPGAWNCCPCSPWAGTSSSGCPPTWRRPGRKAAPAGGSATGGRPARPGGGPGRPLAPAAGPWAGLDPDAVRAVLHEGPGWGSVEGDGSGLRAALPLSWLARVWAPGFPVADGHLVVDVLEASWPQVHVLGLPAPGAEPAVLSIRADGEHWSRAGGEG